MDYKDENVWLMFGDCLERMKEIPDGSVDVVISDIPYGIDFSTWDVTHNNMNNALLGASPAQSKNKVFKSRGKPLNGWSAADKNRNNEHGNWCKSFLNEVFRITKPCSPILLMTGRQYQHRVVCSAEDIGFIFRDCIAWDKGSAPFRAQRINNVLKARGCDVVADNLRLGNLAPQWEPIVYLQKPYDIGGTITDYFLKSGLGVFNSDYGTTNIIKESSRVTEKCHETQKPVSLMSKLVGLFSTEGMVVLDMFMGSGTTGVACINTGRKFIGIEMDENYFNISKNRILTPTDS